MLVTLALGACRAGNGSFSDAELAIRDSLARPPASFEAETVLVSLVDRLIGEAKTTDTQAGLGLLRLQAIDRVGQLPGVLGYNPFSQFPGVVAPPPGLRPWLEAHGADIVFSEPAASWFVPSTAYWALHGRFPEAAAADEIAWQAAQAGLPGECEGVAGCYLGSLLEMAARYVELHPDGRHRVEALEVIRSVLESVDELDERTPLCGDDLSSQAVRPAQLARLRRILSQAGEATPEDARPAIALLERLETRCGG